MRFMSLIENLFKPAPRDNPEERIKRWEADIAESSTDEDPFDTDGHLNRLAKLHQNARKRTKRNPNHPN